VARDELPAEAEAHAEPLRALAVEAAEPLEARRAAQAAALPDGVVRHAGAAALLEAARQPAELDAAV
jgi:hypothetical protein